ncbi:Ribonuclease H-like domain containing protein, partial [Elaphomyces granulatus]
MIRHLLSIHDISRSGSTSFNQSTDPFSSSPQSREEVMKTFEKNLTRWIVAEDMAFPSIESPFFQQMINDIPGISMPFKSRNTLTSRISAEFGLDRARLVEELAVSSQTVALSLDGWTSTNDVSILAVIGHWLSEDFVYKEVVLEFAEIEGTKTGENMGGMVLDLLQELNIETKLLSITGDNASNNETLMDTTAPSIHHFGENGRRDRFSLSDNETNTTRFQGRANLIRCLAHILNLIVKKLLETLKSGNRASAEESIQQVDNRQYLSTTSDSALARLRVLALWISGTPGRKSQWRNICRDHNLPSTLIPYDVDTRWNSTYLMVEAGIKAKRQIPRWISSQSEMPQFTDQDWGFLGQVAKALGRFYEHTLYISQSAPQISYAVPIYYDLHDLMHDAASREGEFENLHEDISGAVNSALDRYSKYYDYMDGQD